MRKIFIWLTIFLLILITGCKKKDKIYTVTFVYEHNIQNEVVTVKENDLIAKPEFKQDGEYKVVSFVNDNGEEFDFSKGINSDIYIYAKWEINKYTYTFYDYDKKTILKQETIPYGTEIIYPENPTKNSTDEYDYLFVGWDKSVTTIEKDISFYPIFEETARLFNVSVLDIDGNVVDTLYAEYGYPVKALKEPEILKIPGYVYIFKGWFDKDTDKLFDFDSEITKDYTIYPKFEYGPVVEPELSSCTLSIMGDSISTFYNEYAEMNSIYHGENQFYYPRYSQTVKEVQSTWWYQAIKGLNLKLGINCSLSGSAAYGTDNKCGSSTARLKLLGAAGIPNIVMIYMGTNDNVSGYSINSIKSSYEKMITYINANYIEKRDEGFVIPKIYLFTNGYTAYTGSNYTEKLRLEINQMMFDLAEVYDNVIVFDLAQVVTEDNYSVYLGDNLHYNANGHAAIAEKLIEKVKSDFGITPKQRINLTNKVVLFKTSKKELWEV